MRASLRFAALAALLWGCFVGNLPAMAQAPETPQMYLDQAQATLVSNPDEGLAHAKSAETLERQRPQPDPAILKRSRWLQAEALFRLRRHDEASALIKSTRESLPSSGSELDGKLLITSGRVARAQGDTGQALKSMQEAFKVFSDLDNPRYMAIALQSIGILYSNAKQYERALDYDQRAVAVYPDDLSIKVASLNLRGNALRELGRFREAREHFEAALTLDAVQASPSTALRLLSNIAILEYRAGEVADAADAVRRGQEVLSAHPSMATPRLLAAVEAKIALDSGNNRFARNILDEAFDGVDLSSTTEDDREAHQLAYTVYAGSDQYEQAYKHLRAAKRLEDAEREVAASANLAILNAEFELSNKELEIANLKSERLEADVALVRARRQQERFFYAAAVVLAVGIIGFLVWQTMQSSRVQRITEALNRRLEGLNQKLQQSNAELEKANSAKTEFLATTSHEIRTPLNAVINLTAAAISETDNGTPTHEKLTTALRSAEHLHEIVSDVLDVARFEGKRVTAHLSDVNVSSAISDVVNLWEPKATAKGLTFSVDSNIREPRFRTDEKLLRQVLSNLLSNAIKFTQEGSVHLEVLGPKDDEPLEIRVTDTGIGIDAKDQQLIFESFRQIDTGGTRSFAGTGLGLAICRQITSLLGGSIDVQSNVGVGTVFIVTLPVLERVIYDEEPEPARQLSDEDIDSILTGLRVLAAEDNSVNAMVIQAILKSKVEALTIVENGQEAVNAVQEGSFDIVLMDKQMPVMDGVESTKQIRALGSPKSSIPIIAVTADAFAAAKDELLEAGANAYLSKPIKPDDLKQVIAENVTSSDGTSSPTRCAS